MKKRLVNVESWPTGSFAAGIWTYRLYDSWDTVDIGSVGSIGLTFTPIPEPGVCGFLGLALVAGLWRRKR